MASSPGYDPNKIESPNGYASILHSPSACPGSSSALLNRATQGLYAPGSTFKTVTAAAALDSGIYTPDSQFFDPGYCTEYGKQVYERAATRTAPERVRQRQPRAGVPALDQRRLLRHRQEARRAARSSTRRRTSASTRSRRSSCRRTRSRASGALRLQEARALRRRRRSVDPGRLAFGQEQHARDAAADGARRRRRRERRHDHGSRTSSKKVTRAGRRHRRASVKPQVWKHAMKPETAAALNADDAGASSAAARARRRRSRASRSRARRAPPRPAQNHVYTPGSSSSRPPTTRRSPAPSSSSTS